MRVLVLMGLVFPPQLTLWRATAEKGIDVHIAGAIRSPWSDGFPWDASAPPDLPTHLLQPVGPSWLLRRGYQWWGYRDLPHVIRRIEPDLIHVIGETWSVTVLQALGMETKVSVHSWDNLYRHGQPVEDAIRRALARRNLRRVAGFVSANQRGLDLAFRHGLDRGTPTTVAPPVLPAPDHFRPGEHKGGKGPKVGYVGRLVPEKGVDWLITSMAEIDDLALNIYGTGPDETRLRDLARELGVDARFHGPQNLEEMPAVFSSLDIVVVPSRSTPRWEEQFGRVAVEAMFADTAVIVSDSGALPEVVGDAGVVVPEGDKAQLARVLEELASNPNERRRRAAAALRRARLEFDPSVVALKIIGVWKASI